MAVKIAVPRENRPNERRVALVPAVAARLKKLGADLALEAGAGDAALIPDALYAKAGVAVGPRELSTDIVLKVQPPSLDEARALREGSVLLSFVYAHREAELVKVLRDRKITCFAMELVPRITRAQAMDALSSQAALAGYYGALLGATQIGRMLPMTTFATGSIRPGTILVMGVGVAGLSAIATARRIGARVEGYDVRPEVKEQVESLGAKFIDTGVDARGQGGYARELTQEEKDKIAAVVTKHIQAADVIITTAAIPGRPSPKLINKAQVDGMKPGAVIVDLAAEGGGNTEYTKAGETIRVGNVTIVAPLNVPSLLAEHASELYSKNLLNFLELIVKDGNLTLNWEDEVVAKSCLTHAGQIKNEAAKKAVEG
ncbi:MAG TPA: NAD(P) transhydrogenase subunit alpha [Candidatus Binatia bacterium]|nr:NAD(P) transhydrogenase subunit alpha [Candidatus Binatia bacterium]